MQFEPTQDQKQALEIMVYWWQKLPKPYLTVGGYAGTGKTTLLAIFRHIFYKLNKHKKVAFCAYTGKASQVLGDRLKLYQATYEGDSVSTIHSLIYAPVVDEKGGVIGWKVKPKIQADLIVVDEASMIDRHIWEDLLSFGVPILAVGDHGQLPPINPGFNLMSRLDARLETIQRQAADNPIIQLSMMARNDGHIPVGNYGKGAKKVDRYESACGSEVEEYIQSHLGSLLILTGFNWSRIKLNQEIRRYLGFESVEPENGDRVICLKNNWEKGIYNGMSGKIKNIKNIDERVYEAEINMENGSLFLGLLLKEQFNAPTNLTQKIQKRDEIALFDFGYALTVHKAQGSQAKDVLLFEERNKHMSDDDWRRWLYTGVTRAEETLMIVGN